MITAPSLPKKTSLILILWVISQYIISVGNDARAQYHLSFGSNYIYCFGERIIDLQGSTYHLDHTQGFEFLVRNRYHIEDTKLDARLNIGFRHLTFAGRSENIQYKGSLNKCFASGGFGYQITERIGLNAYIEAENNKPFDQFIIGSGDLFRVNLAAELAYSFHDKFNATLLVSRAMTPITEAYIFTNPQYQFRVGLNYRLF